MSSAPRLLQARRDQVHVWLSPVHSAVSSSDMKWQNNNNIAHAMIYCCNDQMIFICPTESNSAQKLVFQAASHPDELTMTFPCSLKQSASFSRFQREVSLQARGIHCISRIQGLPLDQCHTVSFYRELRKVTEIIFYEAQFSRGARWERLTENRFP